MSKKVFDCERDVRSWWRDEARSAGEAESLFWVEPRTGGTFGLPDLFYAWNGVIWPFELKVGKIENGVLRAGVRAQQKAVWRRMSKVGVVSTVCVGLLGTRRVMICPSEAIITGKAETYDEVFRLWEIKQSLSIRFQVPFFPLFERPWKEEEGKRR